MLITIKEINQASYFQSNVHDPAEQVPLMLVAAPLAPKSRLVFLEIVSDLLLQVSEELIDLPPQVLQGQFRIQTVGASYRRANMIEPRFNNR